MHTNMCIFVERKKICKVERESCSLTTVRKRALKNYGWISWNFAESWPLSSSFLQRCVHIPYLWRACVYCVLLPQGMNIKKAVYFRDCWAIQRVLYSIVFMQTCCPTKWIWMYVHARQISPDHHLLHRGPTLRLLAAQMRLFALLYVNLVGAGQVLWVGENFLIINFEAWPVF